MILEGRAHRFGDHVDTDVIIPGRYLTSMDPQDLAAHCMEGLDPDFPTRVQPGDIVVAGRDFGCGSSREHAVLAPEGAGGRRDRRQVVCPHLLSQRDEPGVADSDLSCGRRGAQGWRHRPP